LAWSDGLERWHAEHPDLVLLEVMLPSLDGREVCRLIRRESTPPIVMLPARADPIDVVVGLESGADDYARRPFGKATCGTGCGGTVCQGVAHVGGLTAPGPRAMTGPGPQLSLRTSAITAGSQRS